MKKNIIIFGLIAGLIVTALMTAAMTKLIDIQGYTASMVFGYTTMLVAFSLIFVVVKNSRDKYGDGTITFGKALRVALMVTLVASTTYVVIWMMVYNCFMPGFYTKYAAHELVRMKADGASQADLQAKRDQIRLYSNLFYIIFMTYLEILPVGLIVSLLAAVILRRKPMAEKAILTS